RAVQVTGVVPIRNWLPERGVQPTGMSPPTVSTAVAANVTTAVPVRSALTVIVAGNVSTGAVVSVTVTVKVAVPMLPAVSVDVQVTVLSPSGNTAGDDTITGLLTPVTRRHTGAQGLGVAHAPSTTSLADAVNDTSAPPGPVASTAIGPGTTTAGA